MVSPVLQAGVFQPAQEEGGEMAEDVYAESAAGVGLECCDGEGEEVGLD